jgi:hypothetical protein
VNLKSVQGQVSDFLRRYPALASALKALNLLNVGQYSMTAGMVMTSLWAVVADKLAAQPEGCPPESLSFAQAGRRAAALARPVAPKVFAGPLVSAEEAAVVNALRANLAGQVRDIATVERLGARRGKLTKAERSAGKAAARRLRALVAAAPRARERLAAIVVSALGARTFAVGPEAPSCCERAGAARSSTSPPVISGAGPRSPRSSTAPTAGLLRRAPSWTSSSS